MVNVSRHAKKRIKQRVHKNYKKVANQVCEFGVEHNQLKGRLKKHIDWMVFNQYRYATRIKSYRLFNDNVYLFGDNSTLITVLHLPNKFMKLSRRLTKENYERI